MAVIIKGYDGCHFICMINHANSSARMRRDAHGFYCFAIASRAGVRLRTLYAKYVTFLLQAF